ncbi:cytochrome P450 [Epithele typhae]|uniref:cytochrome P450 n=1 Tax=Epithele typhae TaxID=378194 RepID=UPI002008D5CA|nr:cytochrome P450 [Epithele typhae]KAH9910538.1 cytochrome P450 [Epithele typhae]
MAYPDALVHQLAAASGELTTFRVVLGIFFALTGWLGWQLWNIILPNFVSKLIVLPAKPGNTLLLGHSGVMKDGSPSLIIERWMEELGTHTILSRDFLNLPRLWTEDLRAINHILTHSTDYQKPEFIRRALTNLLGSGVLVTEAEQHRQQRRVMNPAFGPAQIGELTGVFVDKSIELRDVLDAQIPGDSSIRIDVLKWLSRTTLDIIGRAGFNYEFNVINPKGGPNELSEAFSQIFNPANKPSVMTGLRLLFPILSNIMLDADSRRQAKAQDSMRKTGMQLIQEKKEAIAAEGKMGEAKLDGFDGPDLRGRDILTLLLKANMATDIPESQRLSDEDVLAREYIFLVAGHESTSTATTWCLWALAQDLRVQDKLRDELLSLSTDVPTMDELNSPPYLDMVVRESLRVHSPVPTSIRIATKDDVLPLSAPVVDKYGNVHEGLQITEGDGIVLPLSIINRSETLWGSDAKEFRPERWEEPPEAVSAVPGVWGHLMSFIGGARACIGFRFSIIEMKALLYVLIRAFEFELAVPTADIEKEWTIAVGRPVVKSEREKGGQMPLLVKRYRAS